MKVNLFINSRKVKSVNVRNVQDIMRQCIKRDYKVTIIGHKDMFGKHIVTTILRPTHLLNNPNKEVDLNCEIYGGTRIE